MAKLFATIRCTPSHLGRCAGSPGRDVTLTAGEPQLVLNKAKEEAQRFRGANPDNTPGPDWAVPGTDPTGIL